MARRRQSAKTIDFTKQDGATRWFRNQPRSLSIAISARAALRVFQTFPSESEFILPMLRAIHLAWSTGVHPERAEELIACVDDVTGAFHALGSFAESLADESEAVAARVAYVAASATRVVNFEVGAAIATRLATRRIDVVAGNGAANIQYRADASMFEASTTPQAILCTPLWSHHYPVEIDAGWIQLTHDLLARHEEWEVWVNWCQDRINGRSSLGAAFGIAVATLPNELWKQGPAAVNARVKELIAEHTPPEPIPRPRRWPAVRSQSGYKDRSCAAGRTRCRREQSQAHRRAASAREASRQ